MEKDKIIYVCGVDWQHEMEAAIDGVRCYPSPESLKAERPCWETCGIVELRVELVKWVEKQDLFKNVRKRRKNESKRKRTNRK